MSHILCTIKNVDFSLFKKLLKKDAAEHKKRGMVLENVWQNADDKSEVYFLFHTKNLAKSRKFIEETHRAALKMDPKMNLPKMVYLK